MRCRVHHYLSSSGWGSWGADCSGCCLSLWWVTLIRRCHVLHHWVIYPMGFWSSDHVRWAYRNCLLFFRIACHSLWPISHFHTIPLEWCVFLYAFVFGASISFPHLFFRSLNEIHRSSVIGHALIHPIFIHRILLYLGLDGFPSGEPVHVIAPIGATFLH